MMKTTKSRNGSSFIVSKVPRWGALTFYEEVKNDMVVNRVKDIHAKPPKMNFLKYNALNVLQVPT